jgi:Ca2+:H+ antiporter
MSPLRSEIQFVAGAVTSVIFLAFAKTMLGDLSNPIWTGSMFLWLFAVMLWTSFGVVRHADCLAILLGEPPRRSSSASLSER